MKRNHWGCLVLGMAAFGFVYGYLNRPVVRDWKEPSRDFVNEMAQGYRYKFGTWPTSRDAVRLKLTPRELDGLPRQFWPADWLLVGQTPKAATYLLSFPPEWSGGQVVVKVGFDPNVAKGFAADFEEPH